MKVKYNDKQYQVRWRYVNNELQQWAEAKGLAPETVKKMTDAELKNEFRGIMKLTKTKSIPQPNETICIISNDEGIDLAADHTIFVKGDKYSKEIGRKLAFTNVLNNLSLDMKGKK